MILRCSPLCLPLLQYTRSLCYSFSEFHVVPVGSCNPSVGSTIEHKLLSSHFPSDRFTIGRTVPINHYVILRQWQRRLDTNTINVMQVRSVSAPVTTTSFSPLEMPSLASVTSPSSTYEERMVLNNHLKLTWGQNRANEHRGYTRMSRGHVERERIPIWEVHFGHLLVCKVYMPQMVHQ